MARGFARAESPIAELDFSTNLEQADMAASLDTLDEETRQSQDYRRSKIEQLTPLEAEAAAARIKLHELQDYESFLREDGKLAVQDEITRLQSKIFQLSEKIAKLRDVVRIVDDVIEMKERRKIEIIRSLKRNGKSG